MAPRKLYSEMVNYLESMITTGAYLPGEKLPAQRELCTKFSLTKGTVGRGLALLEQRGLVEIRQGAGTYVKHFCSNREDRDYQIGVMLEEYGSATTYCGHILRGIQSLANERRCGLHLNFTAYTDYDAAEIQRYAEALDGLILLGVYDTTASRVPRTRPCVGVNMYRSYGSASIIDLDPVAAAELAAEYFAERNIKRVVCYTVNPNGATKSRGINNTFKFRAHMMASCWNGECVIVECDEHINEFPEEWFNESTGFLFVSGSRFENAARAYAARTGRTLTDDACVLTVDGKSLLVPEFLPVDTIGTDYFSMGRLALEECLNRIKNPGRGPNRIYQNVYFASKESQENKR